MLAETGMRIFRIERINQKGIAGLAGPGVSVFVELRRFEHCARPPKLLQWTSEWFIGLNHICTLLYKALVRN